MDTYKKTLIIVILLVYLNALVLFVVDRTGGATIIGPDGRPLPDPSKLIDLSGAVKSQEVEGTELKRTKDGEVILYDNQVGDLELSEFVFDQRNEKIETTVVKFRIVQVQPDDICYKEIIYENLSDLVPASTTFMARDVVDAGPLEDALGLDPGELDLSALDAITYGSDSPLDLEGNPSDYLLPREVVTCKSQPPVYLASLFGRIYIMQGPQILATYTVTFEKNHRDKDTLDELVVERKVFLPPEPGQYVIRMELYDRLSSKKIIREQVFSIS